MKNIKLLALSFVVFGFIMTMSSCQKDPLPTDPSKDNFSSSDFELIIIDNTECDMSDGDETYNIQMLPAYGYSDEDCESMGWEKRKDNGNHYGNYKHDFKKEKRGFKLHLGFILRKLNNKFEFTPEQIDSVKLYIKDHIACVKAQMIILRDSEKRIIDSANQERTFYIQIAKDSSWTTEQLKDSLKALNLRTRLALKDNPVRLEVCLAVRDCRLDFFNRIESILTPDQYLIWLVWKDKLPEIKCGDE